MSFNPLNTELNPICHFLALVGAHHIVHVSRVRFESVTHLGNSGLDVFSYASVLGMHVFIVKIILQ
jgi:hypothetical protein